MNRFDYVAYDDTAAKQQAAFKKKHQELEELATVTLRDGRAKALFFTKLEEAYMWAGKAIRDDQLARGAPVPLQEGRKSDGQTVDTTVDTRPGVQEAKAAAEAPASDEGRNEPPAAQEMPPSGPRGRGRSSTK